MLSPEVVGGSGCLALNAPKPANIIVKRLSNLNNCVMGNHRSKAANIEKLLPTAGYCDFMNAQPCFARGKLTSDLATASGIQLKSTTILSEENCLGVNRGFTFHNELRDVMPSTQCLLTCRVLDVSSSRALIAHDALVQTA
jgi:hypothetical protein